MKMTSKHSLPSSRNLAKASSRHVVCGREFFIRYLYIYVCICICVYTHTHTYTHTHAYSLSLSLARARTHTHTNARAHTYTRTGSTLSLRWQRTPLKLTPNSVPTSRYDRYPRTAMIWLMMLPLFEGELRLAFSSLYSRILRSSSGDRTCHIDVCVCVCVCVCV